jgi:hypothetical protein
MAKKSTLVKQKGLRRGRPPAQMSLFDLLDAPVGTTPAEGVGKPTSKRRPRRPTKSVIEKPAVLTPAEAALYLNIKPATLKSWRAKGIGPAFVKRAARLIGYTPAALDAYLSQTTPRKA